MKDISVNLQEAFSSYLVLVEGIIWFLVKHHIMILGFTGWDWKTSFDVDYPKWSK